MATIRCEINGTPRTFEVPPEMPLLWVLRDVLNLTGTKYGCGVGVCSACAVHVDGRTEQSCQLAAGQVDGATVTTVEGLAGAELHRLQAAWLAEDVPQCGYCQAGQLMQAAGLLATKPNPTDAEIDLVMAENLCRCGTYNRVRAAIKRAAARGSAFLPGGLSPDGVAAAALVGLGIAASGNGHGNHRGDGNGSQPIGGSLAAESSAPSRRLTRRDVLKGGAAFQLAILLGGTDRLVPRLVNLSATADAAGWAAPDAEGDAVTLTAWIQLAADESATITVSKSEMGQGVRTALAMIVAEELDVSWENVRILQAPASSAYGNQMTAGSTSTRTLWTTLRTAGATARAMLVAAAAQTWSVPASSCGTEPGVVVHRASGRRLTYGALAAAAAKQPVPPAAQVTLKDPSQFRIIGQATARVDNRDVVTGQAVYGLDVRLPGMWHAVVARVPQFAGRITAFDDTAAKQVPGVRHVVRIPSGIAVVADNTWAALRGRQALQLTLDPGPEADLDDAGVTAALSAALDPLPDLPAAATSTLDVTYELPFLAHATMEPMNCVADVKPNSCALWAPTQGPGGVQQAVASALGRQPNDVTVHVTLMGGGLGRRSQSDFALEAAHISNAVKAPVQVLWTRADDMRHDYYRPASHHRLRAAVDAQGTITAWQHAAALALNGGGNANAQQARPPYDLPTPAISITRTRLSIPSGFWRSVGLSQLTFANESFLDEIAAATEADPLALRKALLNDNRLRAAVERAAAEAGWGQSLPTGEGRGIACVAAYGSYCAVVAHVAVKATGQVTVKRLTAAVDCGVAINPRSVEAQIEGALVDGLATALMSKITITEGRVQESHFNDFQWTRMPDVPPIDVHLLPSSAAPGGVGELGYPAAAPAIANAIFAATGRRVRRLPIRAADLAGSVPTPEPTASPTVQPTATPNTIPETRPIYLPRVDSH